MQASTAAGDAATNPSATASAGSGTTGAASNARKMGQFTSEANMPYRTQHFRHPIIYTVDLHTKDGAHSGGHAGDVAACGAGDTKCIMETLEGNAADGAPGHFGRCAGTFVDTAEEGTVGAVTAGDQVAAQEAACT